MDTHRSQHICQACFTAAWQLAARTFETRFLCDSGTHRRRDCQVGFERNQLSVRDGAPTIQRRESAASWPRGIAPMEESPLITATSLREHTVKDLGRMAKDKGVAGWHSMRKDQLIRASAKSKSTRTTSKSRSTVKARATSGVSASAKSRSSKTQSAKSRAAKTTASKSSRVAKPQARSAAKNSRRRQADAKSAVSAKVAKRINRERVDREKQKDLAQEIVAATKVAPRRTPVIDDDQ